MHELLLGNESRWAGYLDSCPTTVVPIAILWEEEGEARDVVKGTELGAELSRIGISRVSDISSAKRGDTDPKDWSELIPVCLPRLSA